jgi:hypothetical protein
MSLPQDVLSRAVPPYRSHLANRIQSRAQKEMTTTFYLDHRDSLRRDEMYFFGSFIDALHRCYRIRVQIPQVPDSETQNSSRLASILRPSRLTDIRPVSQNTLINTSYLPSLAFLIKLVSLIRLLYVRIVSRSSMVRDFVIFYP